MRHYLRRPSPALIISILALIVAAAGSAGALPGRNSVTANDVAQIKMRPGKLRASDTTAGDGSFNVATGKARCKRGELLISGGLRARSRPAFGPLRAAMLESGPIPKFRRQQWSVSLSSDLGGAERRMFTVFAYCLVR
jgi:hypothetical protein